MNVTHSVWHTKAKSNRAGLCQQSHCHTAGTRRASISPPEDSFSEKMASGIRKGFVET